MMVNINEAIATIKQVGPSNVRAVPSPGSDARTGRYQIEVNRSGAWTVIVECPNVAMANDIIKQALNRVILG